MIDKRIFTSESVSEGHPDKICDQISDTILDAYLTLDSQTKLACEVLITTNRVVIAGEVRSSATVDVAYIAREVLKKIGYIDEAIGIDYQTCKIENLIHEQSIDIARGVDLHDEQSIGAGDQGIMFGYAERGNDAYMPLPILIAHELVRTATALRKSGAFKYARPDMKSQVTIDYSNKEKPLIDTIVMSIQHDENYEQESFFQYIKEDIINPILKKYNVYKEDYQIYLNPTGKFVIGGPHGDTGLTGRKIIVDTYGGYARHGGGAFSGKDATKVDRSAAYMARYLAKNIVAAKIADRCEIQLGYAIGVAQPVSVLIETFATEKVNHEAIVSLINEHIDLSPQAIIERFKLRRPIFAQTAAYGHFGRTDLSLPWERLDLVELFQTIK